MNRIRFIAGNRTRLTVSSAFFIFVGIAVTMKKKYDMRRDIVRRKNTFFRRFAVCVLIIAVAAAIAIPVYRFVHSRTASSVKIDDIYAQWNAGRYEAVYDMTSLILEKKILHNTALTFRGYAGFYLAVAQTDTVQAQSYLDESINCLRVALLSAKKSVQPQIMYMLGKAYFYKNTLSAYHYYSDLAVAYLGAAQDAGYSADDIPEYLGLSYAALGMTRESIAAFTEALLVRESDVLLLSIAEQYYKNGQPTAAKAYLHRINMDSSDDVLKLKSHALLGQIYLDEKNFSEALAEFQTILEKDPNSADAYYGIGVIYENRGDLIKARAEWRKALRIDVNHQGALKKMAEYK